MTRACAVAAAERQVLAALVADALADARARGIQNAGRRLAELAGVDPREVHAATRETWRPSTARAERLRASCEQLAKVPAGRRARARGEGVERLVEALVERFGVRGLARRLGAHPASVRGWRRGAVPVASVRVRVRLGALAGG